MIKAIRREQLPKCLEIMKLGYENTALLFGMTEENCPYRGRTRLPLAALESEFDGGYMMYAYVLDGRIVSFLSLSFDEQTLYINDIVVHPDFQNRGFGSELMQFAKLKAKELGLHKIALGMVHDNRPLRSWYERNGFHTVKLTKYKKVTYLVGTMECIL